eukprot:COSAG01_NODE_12734_length_1692_cov_29.150195_1_plen_526_part_01
MERKRAGTDNAGEDRPAAKVQRGRRGSLPGAADTTQPEEPSDDSDGDLGIEEEAVTIDDKLLGQDVEFTTRCWQGAARVGSGCSDGTKRLQRLRREASAAAHAFKGRSFWLPMAECQSAAAVPAPPDEGVCPTATTFAWLQHFAAAVFRFHVGQLPSAAVTDSARSGAEFWVQDRQPHAPNSVNAEAIGEGGGSEGGSEGGEGGGGGESNRDGGDGEGLCEGDGNGGGMPDVHPAAVPREDPATINWHFDKDEQLLDQCDIYVHPLIATVTYLSDVGAPTVVIDARIDHEGSLLDPDDNGEDEDDEDGVTPPPPKSDRRAAAAAAAAEIQTDGGGWNAFISYPRTGKHLAFNGRLLHGCPSSCAYGSPPTTHQEQDKPGGPRLGRQQRQQRRLSLLVNVWLNHRPCGVQTLAEADPPPLPLPSLPLVAEPPLSADALQFCLPLPAAVQTTGGRSQARQLGVVRAAGLDRPGPTCQLAVGSNHMMALRLPAVSEMHAQVRDGSDYLCAPLSDVEVTQYTVAEGEGDE